MTCPDCAALRLEINRLENERAEFMQGVAELRAIMANVQYTTKGNTCDSTSTTTNQ
jgi:hypothetical protein